MSKTTNLKIKKSKFLKDLFALYDKHNISISHEDYQGAFELEYTPSLEGKTTTLSRNKNWIKQAYINEVEN